MKDDYLSTYSVPQHNEKIKEIVLPSKKVNAEILSYNNEGKPFVFKFSPDSCVYCTNYTANGCSGICNCTLGLPKLTC